MKNSSIISPLPKSQSVLKVIYYNFFDALKKVVVGEKIHKLEWVDKEFYGVLHDGQLKLHKPDGQLHPWILSDGDLNGNDWITL